MMKTHSIHFVFTEGSDYKDLASVFPDILKEILVENDHFQDEEGEETVEMYITLNMSDLEQNRKPEGYNRKGKYRLIFPMDRKEFYIQTYDGKANDIKRISDRISEILSTSKDFHFSTYINQLAFGESGWGTPGLLSGSIDLSVYEQVYLKNNEVRNEMEGTFVRVESNCNITVAPKCEVVIDGRVYKNSSKTDDLLMFVNTNSPNAKNVNLLKGSVDIEAGVVIVIDDKPTDGKKKKFSK